ncbi:hypothetical protein [Halovivax limisalsi]|uniref:hypothetical protein n=1 Tax=Halovivax limisalsi TaxID=1453760 RepID=UPI001FFC985E|nr:hypothetical protein [Halovivax limisalsi]
MSRLSIDAVEADGTTLGATVSARGGMERFVSAEPFRVNYDRSIEGVPESILVVPVLAQVLPVAWARGATVEAPVVDATFAESVSKAGEALLDMHDFLEGGRLVARTVEPDPPDAPDRPSESTTADESETGSETEPVEASGNAGLLFTGGVDSTASYVAHRDEDPTLISVRGWTITPAPSDDEKWDALRRRVETFARERGLETAFVESNVLEFLDHPMLLAHYKRHVDGAWYSSVGHGLGLTGLCAPLAYASGLSDLYVAATHWDGVDLAWGSHPRIENAVAWTGTRCHHDGYDRTRQERIDAIADYVAETDDALELQTCNDRTDGNCGACEKCYRTAVGLRLAGLDPTDHGYSFTERDYETIRRGFERGRWVLGQDERYMWADIRDRVGETTPRSATERAFFEWLADADLDDLVDDATPPLTHRLLRAGARHTPTALYRRLYPVWRRANAIGDLTDSAR